MTHLKSAVDQQRNLLIKKLAEAGILDPSDLNIHSYSIAELVREYERTGKIKKDEAI